MDIIVIIVIAMVVAALIKLLVFRTSEVLSGSMEPTLQPADRIVMELVTPRFLPFERGDIVVFSDPDDWLGDGVDPEGGPTFLQLLNLAPETTGYIVKRVLATPGETIQGFADGTITINGEVFDDPYAPTTPQDPFIWTLSAGEYWMMGDNRAFSTDSRRFGPVPEDHLVGRAVMIFAPLDRLGGVS